MWRGGTNITKMDNSVDNADTIVLERKLEAPWGLVAVGIFLFLGAAYLQIWSNLFSMSQWHWGLVAVIFFLIIYRPLQNANRTVRFQIDKLGVRFDPILGSKRQIIIGWNDIESISLDKHDGWTIFIKLNAEARRARSLILTNIQITEHYGIPLNKMFDLLVASREKFKSQSK